MFTATLFILFYAVAWIVSKISYNVGSSMLNACLYVVPIFLIILIVYSVVVGLIKARVLREFKISSAPVKALSFFIYSILGTSIFLAWIGASDKTLEIIAALIFISCILTYWILFIEEYAENNVSFFVAIPIFVFQEFKAVVVAILSFLILGLTIGQLIIYTAAIIGILIGAITIPSWNDLFIVRYFKWLDT